MSTNASSSLDFNYLTTRHHQASRVSKLCPRPALKLSKRRKALTEERDNKEKSKESVNETYAELKVESTLSLKDIEPPSASVYFLQEPTTDDHNYALIATTNFDDTAFTKDDIYQGSIEGDIDVAEKQRKLKEFNNEVRERIKLLKLTSDLLQNSEQPSNQYNRVQWEYQRRQFESTLEKKFHNVDLDDWENQIVWDRPSSAISDQTNNHNLNNIVSDDEDLLQQTYDPKLECMDFSKHVIWDSTNQKNISNILQNASTLILNPSTTATSISKCLFPSHRPEPFVQSEAYGRRFEREMNSTCISTATASGIPNSLNPDSEQLEAIIAARQAKRAQMAIDKSHRVTEAMGTLALGGGKGRTITSSLMGPGGTERTGRPSRHAGSSSAHDAEIVEQLEIVYNHTLVKPDLSKSELRQFHRPRLMRAVVMEKPWMFYIRIRTIPKFNKGNSKIVDAVDIVGGLSNKTDISPNSSSPPIANTAMTARNKIRSEMDLSPTLLDGSSLVLLEYCEEKPPMQLSKGMACRIVNYYRGDKSKCPISAGGGEKPIRKREGSSKNDSNTNTSTSTKAHEKPPRLLLPPPSASSNFINELVGIDYQTQLKKLLDTQNKTTEDQSTGPKVDVLPEGVTEILHPKVHGPFIGEVEEGVTQPGLISNLFAAPIARHEPSKTDFLITMDTKRTNKDDKGIPVIIRSIPSSVFTVGQTEPKIKIFAPNTTGEKNFTAPFITYQIAKALAVTQKKQGHGLRFDEINDRLFANTVILPNALRQRIKQVAMYDKNTQIWTTKPEGMDEFPGVEALGRRFSAEGVAAYESACAAVRRMCDLGIHELSSGSSSVTAVGQAMIYLNGVVTAARERKSKMAKMADYAKKNTNNSGTSMGTHNKQWLLAALYEKCSQNLDTFYRIIRRKQEVARFIYEELQLAPWHLTSEFIEVHKNAQGTAMMRLTGLGDPSGRGEGYNFLREVDTKPNKTTNNTDGALNAQIKKITGTENDLRKLTMKQMAALLKSYGMGQKEIDTLKRWDRVHVIRDLSTKAASDGMGDGLERYARGEKMKLSDQKQMYRERIQEIWRRQRAALARTDITDYFVKSSSETQISQKNSVAKSASSDSGKKQASGNANPISGAGTSGGMIPNDPMSSDSDSDDDDDLAAALEEDMLNVRQTNQIVADHVRGAANSQANRGSVRDDAQDLSKDARELAALMRQREEERAAQEGLLKSGGSSEKKKDASDMSIGGGSVMKRKVVRRRITKTFPDGTQTTTFKFITREDEVDKVITQKQKKDEKTYKETLSSKKKSSSNAKKNKNNDTDLLSAKSNSGSYHSDSKVVGHSFYEEDDDENLRSKPKIQFHVKNTARVVTTTKINRSKSNASTTSTGLSAVQQKPPANKAPKVQQNKQKEKNTQEKKMKKRQREAEEADIYSTASKRKGTSNRRERGAARDRMPHVMLSDRFEAIRSEVEKRDNSGPFHRPVNRNNLPKYYEIISDPIDLQTIRDKNQRYDYRTIESFLSDFELMKDNAIQFNGIGSILGDEATAIYDFVKLQIEQSLDEFSQLEEAVKEQMNGNRQITSKKFKMDKNFSNGGSRNGAGSISTANVVLDGVETTVNIGNIPAFLEGETDSDDSEGITL